MYNLNSELGLPNQGNKDRAGVCCHCPTGVLSTVYGKEAGHLWERQLSLPSPLLLWPMMDALVASLQTGTESPGLGAGNRSETWSLPSGNSPAQEG